MTSTHKYTIAHIAQPELAAFGKQLLAEGFKVYVFRSDVERVAKGGKESCARHIAFSRIVDGQECFGSVDYSLAGYQFYMPIKPSRKNGSSMFISNTKEAPEFDSLTLDNAKRYASPTGYNPLVGTQKNDPHFAYLYVEVTS